MNRAIRSFLIAGVFFAILGIAVMISVTKRADVRAEADNEPVIVYGRYLSEAEILANACVSSADVETLAGCIDDVLNGRKPFQ